MISSLILVIYALAMSS